MPGRGRRNPALLTRVQEDVAAGIVYVCGARPLKFGEYELTEGVEVPGARTWRRLQSWVDARRVRQVLPGETYTPFEEWKAPIDAARAAERLAAAKERSERLELEAAAAEEKALGVQDPSAEGAGEIIAAAISARATAEAALVELHALEAAAEGDLVSED